MYKVIIEYFFPLSHVMAKARQDGQLLDLPLSLAFNKLVLGEELDLYDILSFEAEFGKILHEMQILVSRKKFLGEEGGGNQRAIADLRFCGAPIEDLCLDFSLPGYPEYILKEEETTVVNINDLEEYISSVVDATVKAGITRQMEAFRAGFNQLRPWIKTGVHKYLDNSGDFDESVSAAENDNGASSGNMNFEERVHPQTRANYEATDQGYNANKGLDGDGNAEEGNPPKEQSGSNIMKYDECPNCELRGTMLPQDSSNVDWLGHRIMSFAVRHQERFGSTTGARRGGV